MSQEAPVKRQKGNPFSIRLFDPEIVVQQFQPGDAVYCRDKQRRGLLVQQDDSDKWYIQYNGTSHQQRVSLKRLLPIYSMQSLTIVVTSDTIYYRQLATSQTTKENSVLEIGCSTGKTSEILSKHASSYVGFDTSKNMVEETLVKIGGCDCSGCHQVDALKDPTLAHELACQFSEPSIIFMDIGGNRELVGVIRMLHWIINSFSSVHLVVVKSKALFESVQDDCNQKGILEDSERWLERQHILARAATLPRHPLQAPKMVNPATGTLICRYHNYHAKGCYKGSGCPYDHDHCHICLEQGHVARNCPLVENKSLEK